MLEIRKVTIIGANGIMGSNIAGIFAAFGAAEVYLVSRTIEKSMCAKNMAYKSVRAESIKPRLFLADFSELKECVDKSDLIFESGKEDWQVKTEIHLQIAKALDEINYAGKSEQKKVICSGTSGMSITRLAELYPEKYRSSIIGMHFFNPPYNMTLCELISTKYTNRMTFEDIKEYIITVLRRNTVEVKDSPAFLGNRIGFQFINEALQMAERYKYNGGIDYIDSLLGAFTGRVMPPLVTADFVGLDVHKAIIENLYKNTNDYAHSTFILPRFVEQLILEGKLGRKTREGLYKTVIYDSEVKVHYVYDIEHGYYREIIKYTFPFVEEMVSDLRIGRYDNALKTLVDNKSVEAEICCQFLLKYILYSMYATKQVGYDIHAADDVMASGFNWCPPFALMEAFGGVEKICNLCHERIDSKIVNELDLKCIFEKVEKSKYDYRRFLLAKC